MRRGQIVGFALLVGGLLVGSVGWATAENEVYGFGYAFVGLVTLLCGGMLLHNTSD